MPIPSDALASPTNSSDPTAAQVAFARDPLLGLVAATGDEPDSALGSSVLRHFGFAFDAERELWRLPRRMPWPDQVAVAAKATTLLAGLGHQVVADQATTTAARDLAAQAAPVTTTTTPVPIPAASTPAAPTVLRR